MEKKSGKQSTVADDGLVKEKTSSKQFMHSTETNAIQNSSTFTQNQTELKTPKQTNSAGTRSQPQRKSKVSKTQPDEEQKPQRKVAKANRKVAVFQENSVKHFIINEIVFAYVSGFAIWPARILNIGSSR